MFDPNSDELTIAVDHREGESGLAAGLREAHIFDVVETQLEIGDVQIEKLVIERKTVKDLERSLEDGRLMRQAVIMRRVCYKRLFLVEGELSSISPAWQAATKNALNSISVRLQTPVIYTKDLSHSIRIILKSALWEYRLGGTAVAARYKRPKEDDEFRQRYVLMGFPNLGPHRARALLKHFGSLRAILNATEAELQQVDGVGKYLAREFVRLATLVNGNQG